MLYAAQVVIETTVEVGAPTSGRTGATIRDAAGPLQTVLSLLSCDDVELCLVTTALSPLGSMTSPLVRSTVAEQVGLPSQNVLIFSSHDHCVPLLAASERPAWQGGTRNTGSSPCLLPMGKRFVSQLEQAAARLRDRLSPVTVHWAVGREGRITYNRKGRRADGSTYFMREEDRKLVARDYNGDIDPDATVTCFMGEDGRPAGFLTHFTGHPVTAYHPENPVAFGEWPQVACDVLGKHFGDVPCGFMQGCCGDSNSKHFLSGDIEMATRLGSYLGDTFIKAAKTLTPSRRTDLGVISKEVHIPLARLPTPAKLQRDLQEIDDFLTRAEEGDENTLTCVGLNFPRALSPAYRAKLIRPVQAWTQWARRMHSTGGVDTLPKHLAVEIHALRIGDVGIVGLPCEPFMGIGRRIKAGSPLPVNIACGYTNLSYGYVTDAPNTGDREYMSSFYRYTPSLPPYRRPAGDVLAREGVRMLTKLAREDR